MIPRLTSKAIALQSTSNAGRSFARIVPCIPPQTSRLYSVDIAAQPPRPAASISSLESNDLEMPAVYTRFKDLVISSTDFNRLVKDNNIGQAVRNYDMLKSKKKSSELSASDLQEYVIMLCKHRPSPDFAMHPKKVAEMVEGVLTELRSRQGAELEAHIYPVLLRFFVTVGEYERAISLFEEFTSKDIPGVAECYVSMLVCYQKLGYLDKAEALYSEAKEKFQHLEYCRFLADRTAIKIFGKQGKIAEGRLIRDSLLATIRGQKDHVTEKLIRLAFLDSCAASMSANSFHLALEEYKKESTMDNESYNHVLINLSSLGDYQSLMKHIKQHHDAFTPFPGEFKPYTAAHDKEFAELVIKLREKPLAPSTFSDVLFNLSKDAQNESSDRDLILEAAETIFTIYEEQIMDSFDKLLKISADIKSKSMLRILMDPRKPGNVMQVPYPRMYSLFFRTSNPFIAMAKLYANLGQRDHALAVIRRGHDYHSYSVDQLKQIFGADYTDIDQFHKLLLPKVMPAPPLPTRRRNSRNRSTQKKTE